MHRVSSFVDKRKRLLTVVALTASTAGVACSKDVAESHATESVPALQVAHTASAASPVTAVVAADPIPDVPVAKIAAPPSRHGTPQRGIVRDRASFQGEEVARLDNGTSVRVLERKPGGWMRIRWESGGGVAEGWVHSDVVKE
jgi:hypothetical protein